MEEVFVVDLNVLLAAAIKKGRTRNVLLSLAARYKLFVPDYLFQELASVLEDIARRKGIPKEELWDTIESLSKKLSVIRSEDLLPFLPKALTLVQDPSDAPYVATALHLTQTHPKTIILTFNKKDFNTKELEKQNILIIEPKEV